MAALKLIIADAALGLTLGCVKPADATGSYHSQSFEEAIFRMIAELERGLEQCTDTERHRDLVIRMNNLRDMYSLGLKYPYQYTKDSRLQREIAYKTYRYERAKIDCIIPDDSPNKAKILSGWDVKWKEEEWLYDHDKGGAR